MSAFNRRLSVRQHYPQAKEMSDDLLPMIGGTVVVVAVLTLVGSCVQDYRKSTPVVTEVTIVDKSYVPGHNDTTCTTDTDGHISCDTDWVPPSWSIRYEDVSERFTTTVSSGTYDSVNIGDRKVLRYDLGGGYWHARYNDRFILQPPPPEASWPVR